MNHGALLLSKRRARARRDSAGAAMFIVAITLGLLAAMGMYGLAATSADVRAAGYLRETVHGQKAAEHALVTVAETFSPATAKGLVETMTGGSGRQTTNCKTAKVPYTGDVRYRNVEACIRLEHTEMKVIAIGVNPWTAEPFTNSSFYPGTGTPPLSPFLNVEVTNPMDVLAPPGYGDQASFTQVTATVFVDMRETATSPSQTVVLGRGLLTVGPISGPLARY